MKSNVLWSFYSDTFNGEIVWVVENGEESIQVLNRDDAIKLSGILNGYILASNSASKGVLQ